MKRVNHHSIVARYIVGLHNLLYNIHGLTETTRDTPTQLTLTSPHLITQCMYAHVHTILTTPQVTEGLKSRGNNIVTIQAILLSLIYTIKPLINALSAIIAIIMPRCACASEVYGSVFVCLCV